MRKSFSAKSYKLLGKYLSHAAFPISLYLSWRIGTLIYQIFLQPHIKITDASITLYQRIFLSWASYFDAGHYAGIAMNGYQYPQQAFFPLWPLFIKSVSQLGIPVFITAHLLTTFFGLTTFILFYSLASKLIGKSKARYALLLFCSFPSTMFLLPGYTEGLFLTLTLLSFLLFEKKLYFFGSLAGGFASMTRLAGIAIAASYLIINQPLSKKLMYLALCFLGLVSYMIYLQIAFGDALYFVKAQEAWCQINNRCSFTFPLYPLLSYGKLLLMGWAKPSLSFVFYDWVSSIVFLSLLVVVYRKLSLNYFLYSLVVILLPLFSGSTVGMIRYVLVAFPVFFVLPLLINRKLWFYILILFFFLLQSRFIAFFSGKIWVA